MDKFRGVLKKRIALMAAFNLLAWAFIVLTGMYGNMTVGGSREIAKNIHEFQVGMIIGIQMIILFHLTKFRKALDNEEKFKKLYIEENDERRKLIRDKIGGAGFNFAIGVIAVATVAAGFLQLIVFVTLLCVLFFIVSVKGVLKVYYRRKY